MINRITVLFLFLLAAQISFAQKIDTAVYRHLLNADKDEFTKYAQSAGLTTEFDSLSNTLFAKTQGLVFAKPLAEPGNEAYVLQMMVSTMDKENNKSILAGAKPIEEKKDTWYNDPYLYIEWDMENPISKEMWHRVLIYKRK